MKLNGKEENVVRVVAKAWLDVLEKSLMLGLLNYIASKYNIFLLEVIYYISYIFFYQYISETLNKIDFNFFPNKSKKFKFRANLVISFIITCTVLTLSFWVISNYRN